jgi:response regulator RpfG family c-di-GMP phosphodiesterase
MVTAVEDDKSRQKAAQLHCEDYLTKPIKLEELKTRINKVLSK